MDKFVVKNISNKLCLTLGFLFLLTQVAVAEVKVGVVDIQKALAGSKIGQDAQKKYEGELKKSQTEIDSKKGEYEKLQSTIEKQKSSLNPKALADKEEQLLALEKDLKRSFQDKKEELRRENMRIVGELVGKIRKIVESIAKEDGYTLVVEKNGQGVLYADSKNDITDEVVSKFDRQ